MPYLSAIIAVFSLFFPALASASDWQLMSREDGCVPIETLVRRLKLKSTPESPYEFADMMRAEGTGVSAEFPAGFPEVLRGRVVQVRIAENMAPVFVTNDVCANLK